MDKFITIRLIEGVDENTGLIFGKNKEGVFEVSINKNQISAFSIDHEDKLINIYLAGFNDIKVLNLNDAVNEFYRIERELTA